MTNPVADDVLDDTDQRLIAALQCDGRVTAERAAEVLGLPLRAVLRRLNRLLGDGTVRVVAMPSAPAGHAVMLLRIRVLRGKLDTIVAALAARDDIPFVDVSADGSELAVILLADAGNRLVFRQLPATNAVVSVEGQTVMHVYSNTAAWRLDALSTQERSALAGTLGTTDAREPDDVDDAILAALAGNARLPAVEVATRLRRPESTVRRRLRALVDSGRLVTHTYVDPARLGLHVDANIWMNIPPGELDRVGSSLATHPAVHGTLATTGRANLQIAVWLRDLADLHRLITRDLAALGVTNVVDTVLVGRAVKRPGQSVH